MEPVISLQNVGYAYDDNKPALQNISLTIHSGERVVLLGSNGAGKSTLFLCCNGVLTPNSGSITLGGRVLSHSRADLQLLRRSVGLVFQDPDDQMIGTTVESEISFGPMNLHLTPQAVRENTQAALEAMNLLALRNRPPHYLSGGEKKRVSIADILAMQPSLVLLDEPTASLDRTHTALLHQTLEQLHGQGLALLVSTHDVEFAWSWADRAVVLSQGEIIADAPIAEVFSQERVLHAAGLTKPILFEAGQLLFPALPPQKLPRSMEQLKTMIKENTYV
ncbi:MAG: ABC transporter ATP-binding protein [Angelakisella sp.]